MIATNSIDTNAYSWVTAGTNLRSYAITTNKFTITMPPVPWYQEKVEVMWIPIVMVATLVIAYLLLAVTRNSWNLK